MLSVVIPVYNEEARLHATLTAVDRHLAGGAVDDYEILVCDDGSTDGSLAIAEALALESPVRVLAGGTNRGKGAAVRRGMLAARGDPVLFFDADLSTPLAELPHFLSALESGADLAIGSRTRAEAEIVKAQSRGRAMLGTGYRRLVQATLGISATDITCGFKAFRAEAARALFSRQRIEGWSFDAELLFLAGRLGLRIDEIPVKWINRPDSRVRLSSAIVSSFAELLTIRGNALRGLYR